MRFVAIALVIAAISSLQSNHLSAAQPGTRLELREWTRCLAKSDERTASKILLGVPNAFAAAMKSGFFSKQRCAVQEGATSYPGLTFLGPMAEFMLETKFGENAEWEWNSNSEQWLSELSSKPDLASTEFHSVASIGLSRAYLGLCIMKGNPSGAANLLRSKIETEDEFTAVNELSTEIASCSSPLGINGLEMDDLRGAIALVRYRLLTKAKEASHA